MRSLADHFTRGGLMHLGAVGGGKVFLPTNEICVGLGPKSKLDNGLEARPKGYR